MISRILSAVFLLTLSLTTPASPVEQFIIGEDTHNLTDTLSGDTVGHRYILNNYSWENAGPTIITSLSYLQLLDAKDPYQIMLSGIDITKPIGYKPHTPNRGIEQFHEIDKGKDYLALYTKIVPNKHGIKIIHFYIDRAVYESGMVRKYQFRLSSNSSHTKIWSPKADKNRDIWIAFILSLNGDYFIQHDE